MMLSTVRVGILTSINLSLRGMPRSQPNLNNPSPVCLEAGLLGDSRSLWVLLRETVSELLQERKGYCHS